MKNQPHYPAVDTATPVCIKRTSIYRLVSRLQVGLLAQATNKKSVIINDTDKTLSIFADENILAFVVGSLLSNAIHSSSDCCIRVEAFLGKNSTCVRIRNNGVFIYNSLMHSLGQISAAARKLNGSICVQSGKNRTVTVTLSIPSIHAS
jgi:signal transduction histidine kinase